MKRFGLTSLLAVIAIVAVLLALFVNPRRANDEARRKLLSLQNNSNAVHVFSDDPDWLCRLIGIGGSVAYVSFDNLSLPAVDEGLAVLGECTALKTISISQCAFSLSNLSAVPILSSVEELHVDDIRGALDAGELRCLILKCPRLRSLAMTCCPSLDDSVLEVLPSTVQALSIAECPRVTGDFLRELRSARLTELRLRDLPLSASALHAVCEMTTLEDVELSPSEPVDFDWLLLANLQRARYLFLWRRNGAPHDLDVLEEKMPNTLVMGE